MKIVGLTGGIGSGKTTVAKIFQNISIPVFFADDEAKKLYLNPSILNYIESTILREKITYEDGSLNKKKFASIIFNDSKKLNAINTYIHPKVKKLFYDWKENQNSHYVIREAAILIESGSHRDCNKIIVVTADLEKRIERIIKRDQASYEEVKSRIENQISEEERLSYADYIIYNNDEDLTEQVHRIHTSIING